MRPRRGRRGARHPLRSRGCASAGWARASSSRRSRRAFGVLLISATAYIAAMLSADPYIGASGMLGVRQRGPHRAAARGRGVRRVDRDRQHLLDRRRRPHAAHRAAAPHRRLGAIAARRRSARQGLVVGVIGAFLGLVGGTALAAGGRVARGPDAGTRRRARSIWCSAELLIPAAIVALTTWAAAWAGSRRVLTVTPLQALGGSVEASHDAVARRSGAQHHRHRAVRRRRGAARPGDPARASSRRSAWSSRSSAASCRSPGSRSARRWSCRPCCGWSAGCSAARRPRGSRPRTRCATPSARAAWRSAS